MVWAEGKKNIRVILLCLVTFFALIVRLASIEKVPISLFGDELDVGYHAYSVLKTGKDYSGNSIPLHFQSLAEWRTPLYLYSSVPTVWLFGISPVGVRLPAVLFGTLSIPLIYLFSKKISGSSRVGIISSIVLAFSPWHIQYSRAGFEVTQLIFLYLFGLYVFFLSLEKKGRYLWLSLTLLCLTPWCYSTAKLFTPILFLLLFVLYFRVILKFSKKYLFFGGVALLIVGGPIAYSTIYGGGTARFDYISIFTDPTTEPEIGSARKEDALIRGDLAVGVSPSFLDRVFHNKFQYWFDKIIKSYYTTFSADFLFVSGDPNPRHSIDGMGLFYRYDIVWLAIGVFSLLKLKDRKNKLFILFFIILAPFPASLTRDGANHATRLMITLIPLSFILALGLSRIYEAPKKIILLLILGSVFIYSTEYLRYQHLYWNHNVIQSERYWHYGWEQAIKAVKSIESNYSRVIITTRDEPPWIFFAGWWEYDPVKWHEGYPFKKHLTADLGEVSYIDKFDFGSFDVGLYDWGKYMNAKTLYLASAKEVRLNLALEPERTPPDLKLLRVILYPSGEPSLYVFSGI